MYPIETIDPLAMRAPHVLGNLPGWCCREQINNQPRMFYADGAEWLAGEPVNRARLTTFEPAFDWFFERGLSGLAFVLLPECPIESIELPKCFDARGGLEPDARQVLTGALYGERTSPDTDATLRVFLRWPDPKPSWQSALHRLAVRNGMPRVYRPGAAVPFSGLCVPTLKSQLEALNGR